MHISKPTLNVFLAGLVVITTVACSTKSSDQTEEAAATEPTQSQNIASARPVHWGYGGEEGPADWSSLTPVYALCGNGNAQSPIDITSSAGKGAAKWTFDYTTTSLRIAHTEHMDDIIDNGHTIQVSVDEGSTFTFGDKAFSLKQFHFHTPSEHTIDGQHMPMEMHLVHQADDGNLAVVSILFKEGDTANPNIQQIIDNLPAAKGETNHVEGTNLSLNVHLPKDNAAFHYMGSLTTPPCSENVQWMVMREMATVTPAQVKAMSDRIGPNNRPTQALNDRTIETTDLAAN